MKFKVIFAIFNGIILLAFAAIVLLPVVVIGTDYARIFWESNWPLAIVFLLVLAAVNWYFLRNRTLFSLLEREDWRGLISYLHELVYHKEKVSRQRIQLLLHAYVLTGDLDSITRLEGFLSERQPAVVAGFAAEFSLPHLLSADPERILSFAETYIPETSGETRDWLQFSSGFALTLKEDPQAARSKLVDVALNASDDVVSVVALYLLSTLPLPDSESEATEHRLQECRTRLSEKYAKGGRQKLLARREKSLHVLAFKTLVDDAAKWLFEATSAEAQNEL